MDKMRLCYLSDIPVPTINYNLVPFDEEDYGERFGSAERGDDDMINSVVERGRQSFQIPYGFPKPTRRPAKQGPSGSSKTLSIPALASIMFLLLRIWSVYLCRYPDDV